MVGISTSDTGQVPVEQCAHVGPVTALLAFVATPEEVAAADKQLQQRFSNKRPRRRDISGHDEASLSWYFGQGLSIYEKSTFGPIVQKIAMDGYSSAQSGKCAGAGIVEEGGKRLEDRCPTCEGSRLQPRKTGEAQAWCSTCDGSGVVPPYEVDAKWGWCTGCRGTGAGCVERRAQRRPRCYLCRPEPWVTFTDERTGETSRAALVTAWMPRHCCPNCLGTGDEPITANPLQTADSGGGVLANDSALTNFAITSRRLDKVKQRSPALFAALAAFYGDTGARWALHQNGRLFSLYHLTSAGKRLAQLGDKEQAKKTKAEKGKGKATPGKTWCAETMSWAASPAKKAKVTGKKTKRPDDQPHLTPLEAIGVLAALEKIQPHPDRRKLLQAAHEQAGELYQRACDAWIAVTTSKAEQQMLKRLVAKLEERGHGHTAAVVRLHSGAA
jgi:hypothetical protein